MAYVRDGSLSPNPLQPDGRSIRDYDNVAQSDPEILEGSRLMVACPLCILGVPEEDHSPERFASITEAEREVIVAHNRLNPGVILDVNNFDWLLMQVRRVDQKYGPFAEFRFWRERESNDRG